jgi:hypothetical protein
MNRKTRAFGACAGREARATALALLLSAPMFGAVTGTVINRTTGLPQAGATVALNKLGQGGIELIDQAKSDAQGKFTINQEVQGPHVIRTVYEGVSYNHMLPPGTPTTGITVDVYNASKEPGGAKVGKHMILFEPSGGQVSVNETYLVTNTGKTAWNSDAGTIRFFLPAGAKGKAQVQATAPGGMPIGAGVLQTSKPDVYAVDFAVKPGDTRFDVSYSLPYNSGEPLAGKVATKDENTYLIAPNGVTLAGEGLNDLGTEPRTQAHIYGLASDSYKITLTGAEAAAPGADAAAGGEQPEASGPQIEQIMPRVYGQAKLILGLALGILGLGFALLYRANGAGQEAHATREPHERGRR